MLYIQHRSTSSNVCEQRLKQRGFASLTKKQIMFYKTLRCSLARPLIDVNKYISPASLSAGCEHSFAGKEKHKTVKCTNPKCPASSTGTRSLSPGDRVSEANERLPENELQMAAITFMQHGTHWRHSSKTT